MQHVPPFQAAAYKHPTSVGGQWESTIAGPLPPAHIDRLTALEEAQRMAASTAGVLQPSIPPFFNRTAEAAFPAMCDTMPLPAANPPGAPALAAFPNGGGVLERGLRRHLKAQGPARPRVRHARVGPASPSQIVGDGPIGNLCSAAFAADSSSYAIGCARSGPTRRNPLAEMRTPPPPPLPRTAHCLSLFGTQARGGWRCPAGLYGTPGCCSTGPCSAGPCSPGPCAADSSIGGFCAGGSSAADSCADYLSPSWRGVC
jgi:hypothetical protein